MKVMGQQDTVVTGIGGTEVASEKQETLLEGITGQTRVTEVAR
jgi:hypothetical protein